jgi:hypothetical protein
MDPEQTLPPEAPPTIPAPPPSHPADFSGFASEELDDT